MALPVGTTLLQFANVDLPRGFTSLWQLGGRTMTAAEVEGVINTFVAARPDKRLLVRYFNREIGQWKTVDHKVDAAAPLRLGEQVSAYDGDLLFEGDGVDVVQFFVGNRPPPAGGCSATNDCLADALATIFAGAIPGGRIRTKTQLRALVGVPDGEPVPVTKLAAVDALLGAGARLSVEGDFHYQSPKAAAPLVARIRLKNGHYEARADPGRRFYARAHYSAPKPVRFVVATGDSEVHATYDVDGNHAGDIDTATMHSWLHEKPLSAPVVAVRVKSADQIPGWRATRDALAGVLEIGLCGSVKRAALHLWRSTSACLPGMEPPDATEARWLRGALGGGLAWAQPGVHSEALEVDAVSHYASTMLRPQLLLPTRPGRYETLAALPKAPSYGIYRCTIEGAHPALLRTRRNGNRPAEYYTHTDLYRALALGYKIALAQDGEPNALIYDRSACVESEKVFRGVLGRLFAVRADPSRPKATRDALKRPLTSFWGWLCQERRCSRFAAHGKRTGNPVELPGELVDFEMTESGVIYYSDDPETPFYGEWPRAAPFITAKARDTVSKLAEPLVKNGRLLRVYTDSFILRGSELPAVPMCGKDRPELGRWKVEGRGSVTIEHAGRLKKSWKA